MSLFKYIFVICGFVFPYVLLAQNNSTYKNPNESEKVKVQADTILYRYQYEPMFEELLKLRKEKAALEQNVLSLEDQLRIISEKDFDKFLNLQDTTIFGTKFQKMSVSKISKRSLDFYILIQEIHDLNLLLIKIENMNISQLASAENQLTEARRLINDINSFATLERRKITDFLSEQQKQYFRDCVRRYNKLNGSLNRNSQGLNNE